MYLVYVLTANFVLNNKNSFLLLASRHWTHCDQYRVTLSGDRKTNTPAALDSCKSGELLKRSPQDTHLVIF